MLEDRGEKISPHFASDDSNRRMRISSYDVATFAGAFASGTKFRDSGRETVCCARAVHCSELAGQTIFIFFWPEVHIMSHDLRARFGF